jgi:hypothetical protein
VPVAGGSFPALQWLSTVASLLALWIAYRLCRRLLDEDAALVALALLSVSMLLAGFAGNGSIYSMHGLLGLLVIYSLCIPGMAGAACAGLACGLAYLNSYQALVFLPAALLSLAVPRGRGLLSITGALGLLAPVVGFCLLCWPWWLRNDSVFGDAFFSVNSMHAREALGATPVLEEWRGTTSVRLEGPSVDELLAHLGVVTVANLRFLLREGFWWVSSVGVLAIFGAGAVLRGESCRHRPALVAMALLPLFHLVTMVGWPSCELRHFVPLLYLAVPLAVLPLKSGWSLATPKRRSLLTALLVSSFMLSQLVSLAGSDSRTLYYPVHPNPSLEAADRVRQGYLKDVAQYLRDQAISGVIANIELKYHTLGPNGRGHSVTVVQPPPVDDPQILQRALRHYRVQYVMARGERESLRLAALENCLGEVLRRGQDDASVTLFRFSP